MFPRVQLSQLAAGFVGVVVGAGPHLSGVPGQVISECDPPQQDPLVRQVPFAVQEGAEVGLVVGLEVGLSVGPCVGLAVGLVVAAGEQDPFEHPLVHVCWVCQFPPTQT